MGRLEIGKQIAWLRKQKGITQDQLAGMVGVSAGAVSKWETGHSVPDVSLLSPLARALDTSLDVLLSFQRTLSQKEVAGIKQELTGIFLTEGYDTGKDKALSYLNEYPNSVPIKLAVAGLLLMYCMSEAMRGESFLKEERNFILKIYQEILKSGDAPSRTSALFCAASLLMDLERYEESEQMLRELSFTNIDPMPLYTQLLQRQGKEEEAETLCQRMLLQYLNQCGALLSTLMRRAEKTGRKEQAETFLEAVYEIQNRYRIGLGSASFHYCRRRLEEDKKEEAAAYFLSYIQTVISVGYDYRANPYFGRVTLEVDTENQKILRQKMLEAIWEEEIPQLQALTGIPDYEQGVGLLKEAIS